METTGGSEVSLPTCLVLAARTLGWPNHMHALRDALLEHAREHQAAVDVYCCQSYQGTGTYDGVDVCADRVVVEVHSKIKALRDSGRYVDKFSILGSARLPLLVG